MSEPLPLTTHERPTKEDTYCNNCGLMEEYWGLVPDCPAVEVADDDGEVER